MNKKTKKLGGEELKYKSPYLLYKALEREAQAKLPFLNPIINKKETKGVKMLDAIYRGFDIKETEQGWIVLSKDYPATELLKTDFKTEEDVYNQINKIKKEISEKRAANDFVYSLPADKAFVNRYNKIHKKGVKK